MKLKALLTEAALYLCILGVAFMLVPQQAGIGAVPSDPAPALVAYLRIFGGPMVGIAVLNWLARNAEPSKALEAIVIANAVGFTCVASMDVWGVFSGAARPIAKLFLIVHVAFAIAFIAASRGTARR